MSGKPTEAGETLRQKAEHVRRLGFCQLLDPTAPRVCTRCSPAHGQRAVLSAYGNTKSRSGDTRGRRRKSATNRAETESYVKSQAIVRGIIWVHENVFNKYNVKVPSALIDAQLVELAAFMRATEGSAS